MTQVDNSAISRVACAAALGLQHRRGGDGLDRGPAGLDGPSARRGGLDVDARRVTDATAAARPAPEQRASPSAGRGDRPDAFRVPLRVYLARGMPPVSGEAPISLPGAESGDHLQLTGFAQQQPVRVGGDVVTVGGGQGFVRAGPAEPGLPDGRRYEVHLPRSDAGRIKITQHDPTARLSQQVPGVRVTMDETAAAALVELGDLGLQSVTPAQQEVSILVLQADGRVEDALREAYPWVPVPDDAREIVTSVRRELAA
jgi:hypothetical protein